MGWASGMRAGIAIGEAFNKGRQERAYEEIQAQKPEELQGYTAQQGAELEAAAKTGLYDIGMKTDDAGNFQGYTVTPKARLYQGQPVEQPEAGLVAPSQVTDFLGQRYAGALDEGRQTGLRSRAMAEATVDPVTRQRLLADAFRQEREAILAAREDELYPLKRRQAELGVESSQQALTQGQLAIDEAERNAADAKAKKDARSAMSDWSKKNDGKQPTLAAIQSIASQFNIPATEFLTERDAANTLEYKELKKDFGKAMTAGVSGMNTFLASRFDPDATDNISPEVVQDPKTKAYVVMYGGRVLSEYGSHKSFQELAGSVQGMIDNDPLSTIKTLADIEAKKASTAASMASANYSAALARNVGVDPTAKKIAAYEAATGRKATSAELDRFFGVGSKAFDPAAYATVIKTFTDGGMTAAAAKIEADALFGRSKVGGEVDYGAYANQKATKGKGGLTPPPANGATDAPSAAPAPVAARPASSSFAQNQQQRAQLGGLSAQARAVTEATRQARTVLAGDAVYAQLQAARTQAVRDGNRQLASRIDTKLQEIESAVPQRFLPR